MPTTWHAGLAERQARAVGVEVEVAADELVLLAGRQLLPEDCFIAATDDAKRNRVVYLEGVSNQIRTRGCMLAGTAPLRMRDGCL